MGGERGWGAVWESPWVAFGKSCVWGHDRVFKSVSVFPSERGGQAAHSP